MSPCPYPATITITQRAPLRLLNDDRKEYRTLVSHEITEYLQSEQDLLRGVINGDETLIFEYNKETQRQSGHWKSPTLPRPKKVR